MINADDAIRALGKMYVALECMTTRLQPGDRDTSWVDEHTIVYEYIESTRLHDEEPGIEHPSHYQTDGGLECIEVMRQVFGDDAVRTFAKLNAFKYLWRAGKKDGQSEEKDLAKARYYLGRIDGGQ